MVDFSAMRHLLVLILVCVSGCAATTGDVKSDPAHQAAACDPSRSAEGASTVAVTDECQAPADDKAEAPAPVQKIELRPASNDLGPDNVQK